MRMQRIIASLLQSVFILTPLAPAALAPTQPVAEHCVRHPIAKTDAAMSGMHCHEAATHSHHSMAAMPAPPRHPVPADHQFSSNGCCTSHDCCNATVRAQWAQFVRPLAIDAVQFIRVALTSDPFSPLLAARFDLHSGRAPPAL